MARTSRHSPQTNKYLDTHVHPRSFHRQLFPGNHPTYFLINALILFFSSPWAARKRPLVQHPTTPLAVSNPCWSRPPPSPLSLRLTLLRLHLLWEQQLFATYWWGSRAVDCCCPFYPRPHCRKEINFAEELHFDAAAAAASCIQRSMVVPPACCSRRSPSSRRSPTSFPRSRRRWVL